ncbi:MAG: hypothetical protein ACJAYU_001213 [Bradymonadia bacterium]|jgi:hypothetical protein
MAFDEEKRAARSLLAAIEDGTTSTSDTYYQLKDADPTLVYFIFTWIRATYPPSHPAAGGVLGRLGDLCTKYPDAARIAASGKADSVVDWFEDAYEYREYGSAEFVDLIVEKLEG